MPIAVPKQSLQDWLTQQYIIFRGRKINLTVDAWLDGPIGCSSTVSEPVLHAANNINTNCKAEIKNRGLIPDFESLNLSKKNRSKLSDTIVHFYEHTEQYSISFTLKWNPIFKVFGKLIVFLFSSRLNQLHIPTQNITNQIPINHAVVPINDKTSNKHQFTLWKRTIMEGNKVLYNGLYTTCTIPTGKTCVKAIFPLPYGNATTILFPKVLDDGSLVLEAAGNTFGYPGFYFLLQDNKGNFWSRHLPSFKDTLRIFSCNDLLKAEQQIRLWGINVLKFTYEMRNKFP
jgi:hypothetical protein